MEESKPKIILKKPKDVQDNDWTSDMEEEDFIKPAWVVCQEQDAAFRQSQGDPKSFFESNRDSIINDARLIVSLQAKEEREKQARRLSRKEENKKKLGSKVKSLKEARKRTSKKSSKAKKDEPITSSSSCPPSKKQCCQSLKTPDQSNVVSDFNSPPSIASTLCTVSSSASWDRYANRKSSNIKLEGDHVLFPSYDVTHTLEGATCIACKREHKECCEMKYRDFCLQSVIDYIQTTGSSNITDAGLRKAYRDAFTMQAKLDLLTKTGYYETNKMLHLPWCMVQGSLVESLNLIRGTPAAQFLMGKRMANVEEHAVKGTGIQLDRLTQFD